MGTILWETVTVAFVVFGALAVFFLRRRVSGSSEGPPAALWLRFSVLLFGFSVLGLIGGTFLSQFGFVWFLAAMALAAYVILRIVPKLLIPYFRERKREHNDGKL